MIQGGAPGGGARAPPFGKASKCKRAPLTEISWYYPPPLNRVGFRRPQKNSATTPPTESRRLPETTEKFCYYPPPTESRRLGASHERGRLFRKILDLRLLPMYCFPLFTWLLGCSNSALFEFTRVVSNLARNYTPNITWVEPGSQWHPNIVVTPWVHPPTERKALHACPVVHRSWAPQVLSACAPSV